MAELLSRPPRLGSTRLLCIDGRAGSGKTSLANEVARLAQAPLIHLDDIYPGWHGLAAALPLVRTQILEPLAAGRPGRYRRWDWHASRPTAWCLVPVSPLLVVEGVGACARSLADFASLTVWVEASTHQRRARALGRDGDAFASHWEMWAAQEVALLAAEQTAARADLIIDNEES